MSNTRFFTSFPRLRAIWAILRNGSVIWNANLNTSNATIETRSGKVAPCIIILHNLTIDNRRLTLNDMTPSEQPAAEGNVNAAADEDQNVDGH